MKAACYIMTRNVYKDIVPSLKSLLINSDVDKVYILAEDDDIGMKLPDKVEIINISDQPYFTKDSPNWENWWAWIILIRAAFCKIFPDLDRILSLDLDTLVVEDISKLWDIPMGNNYAAGALDLPLMTGDRKYINGGVVLWNLKQLRDGTADEMIKLLNTRKFTYPEQDCLNLVCEGKIYLLNGIYNYGTFSRANGSPKILHFAGQGLKRYYEDERVQEYLNLPWEECVYGKRSTKAASGIPVKKSKGFNMCGACGSIMLINEQKYCHECGKPAKWNHAE